jgi:hypothetical protein
MWRIACAVLCDRQTISAILNSFAFNAASGWLVLSMAYWSEWNAATAASSSPIALETCRTLLPSRSKFYDRERLFGTPSIAPSPRQGRCSRWVGCRSQFGRSGGLTIA